MRLALLTTYLALDGESDSGIGRHFRTLADALTAQGHRVHVVFATFDHESAARALAALNPGWTCEIVSARPPAWLDRRLDGRWPVQWLLLHLLFAWKASRHFDAGRFDVVETHSYNFPALALCMKLRRPALVTRVSTTHRQMAAVATVRSRVFAWEARLESFLLRHGEALLTHTRAHRDRVCAEERLPASRFALVPHGLPDPAAPSSTPPAVGKRDVEFLYVGRFEVRKGADVLLAAIPQVAAAFPDAVFTLAGSLGDGIFWREFQTRHPELAGSRVRALGRVASADLESLYRRCDVFVAPSRYESFGLIYAEAMSHAKPAIGCDTGGIPDVLTHNVTGLLARPGDVPSLVECMSRLCADADLRVRLGRKAREDFVARFSADLMARRSADVYRGVVAATNRLAI